MTFVWKRAVEPRVSVCTIGAFCCQCIENRTVDPVEIANPAHRPHQIEDFFADASTINFHNNCHVLPQLCHVYWACFSMTCIIIQNTLKPELIIRKMWQSE
jgi:hypothetical protein